MCQTVLPGHGADHRPCGLAHAGSHAFGLDKLQHGARSFVGGCKDVVGQGRIPAQCMKLGKLPGTLPVCTTYGVYGHTCCALP